MIILDLRKIRNKNRQEITSLRGDMSRIPRGRCRSPGDGYPGILVNQARFVPITA
jgi:hypothetical protein